MDATQGWFESIDRLRRWQGSMLDQMGMGPDESEYRVVLERPGVRLRRYAATTTQAPVLLIVPAPFKGPYIWDIAPERSVVRRALQRGFAVYLMEWTAAQGEALDYGLDEYAGSLLRACIQTASAQSHQRAVFLAGHSLGGTFAAMYAARQPQHVAGLVLVEAPLCFAGTSGAFEVFRRFDNSAAAPAQRVPGSLYGMASAGAAARAFYVERFADRWASLLSGRDLRTHWRVERWLLDELPLPRRLLEEVRQWIYREDRFIRGELQLAGMRLDPKTVAAPLLAIVDPRSEVVPAQSVLAALPQLGSEDTRVLEYVGDRGVAVQHIGVLLGERAHRVVWPVVFDWLVEQAAGQMPAARPH